MVKISVVIPCFNQGEYIKETIDSVLKSTYTNLEIIVVNDGSTDENTIRVLFELAKGITIYHTENQGLSAARNYGIGRAQGEYILALDSDDLISPTYISKSLTALEENLNLGIVYPLTKKFGVEKGLWRLLPFSLENMLAANVIPCSAVFRKCDWAAVGGYKVIMDKGFEDWEFWLSILELKREVLQIPEVGFYYRIRESSMARSLNEQNKVNSLEKIYSLHKEFFDAHLPSPLICYHFMKRYEYRLQRADIKFHIAVVDFLKKLFLL